MFRNPDGAAHGVPLLFNVGFLGALLLLLTGRSLLVTIASLFCRAFTCVYGHLRPRPDPWLEDTLRDAFAEIDRNLVVILHHEQAPRLAPGTMAA